MTENHSTTSNRHSARESYTHFHKAVLPRPNDLCTVIGPTGKGVSMKDLAPEIHRQRLVIEGYPANPISDDDIKNYLSKMSEVLEMNKLQEPVTNLSSRYGWAGWIHWENSGAHFYAWESPTLFFSVDIYTCKPFDPQKAVKFTSEFLGSDTIEFKEF